MQCPKCQFENPDGIKFCGECGAKLERICPSCSSSNPPQFKFCGECGQKLEFPAEKTQKDLSFEEKLDKIQKYLPKGLTEKILSQREKIEGERKQVTVMFCDMAEFTPLVEQEGAEAAYSLMDQVYELLIHKVHDYEGTINEMTGDGIMALFGAPIALEDAPQKAIRSAYAIHRELARYNDKLREERRGVPPIKMRIGIHTGPVVLGTLGNNLRVEFKAVGETVNLASRVESLAEPGTTYVTEDTFKLAEGFFRFEALGERKIKGIQKSVQIFRPIATIDARTRFDISAERGLTPFVGRNRDLNLMLDGLESAKSGSGQIFLIKSEAGAGKSRLLYEFRKAVSNENVTFLEGKCLSYSKKIAYYPIIDILKSNFNIRQNDNNLVIEKKIKNGLGSLGIDEMLSLPYLLEILLPQKEHISNIFISPETKRERIADTVRRVTIKASEINPLIIAIEDLHWIDKSSEEFLKGFLKIITGARIFLILTCRPEFEHSWGSKSYHVQLTLNRLSRKESLDILFHVLGSKSVEESIQNLVIEKTEGIPFFIEEFCKLIRDFELIYEKDEKFHLKKKVDYVSIPATIQDIILSRVDILSEDAKTILHIGSAIEREFSYEIIKILSKFPEKKLQSHLEILLDSELLYVRGIYPEHSYVFKHALTREIIYNTILRKQKTKLHETIASAIEKLYRENISDYLEVLADHYLKSENYNKCAEYSKKAAKKAERNAFLKEAIDYTKLFIHCLERSGENEHLERKIINARTTLALYSAQMNYLVDAKKNIDPIINKSLKSGYKAAKTHIVMGAYYYFVKEDMHEAFNNLEKAITISKKSGDIISLVLASYFLGASKAQNCEYEKALHYYNQACDINNSANNLWGVASLRSHIGHNYLNQGKIDIAYKTCNNAKQLSKQIDDIYSMSMAYTYFGHCCFAKGFFDEAKKSLYRAVELSDKINIHVWSALARYLLCEIEFFLGEYQNAQQSILSAIDILAKVNVYPTLSNLFKIHLAKIKSLSGNEIYELNAIIKYVNDSKLKVFMGNLRRNLGNIFSAYGDQELTKAKKWAKKAIEVDKQNGAMFELARDYLFLSKICKQEFNESKKKENLNKAMNIFEECGADGWVKIYKKELAEL